jgi:hypothetical protein
MKVSSSFAAAVESVTLIKESSSGDYAPKGDFWNPKKEDEDAFAKDAKKNLEDHGWKETHGIALYSHQKFGNTIADLNSGRLTYHIGHGSEGSKVFDVHPKDIAAHLHQHIGRYAHIMDHKEATDMVGSHIADKYKGLYGGNVDTHKYDAKSVKTSKENQMKAAKIAVAHGAKKQEFPFKVEESADMISAVVDKLTNKERIDEMNHPGIDMVKKTHPKNLLVTGAYKGYSARKGKSYIDSLDPYGFKMVHEVDDATGEETKDVQYPVRSGLAYKSDIARVKNNK